MNRDLHYLQLRKTVSQEGKHCRSTVLEKGMFRGWIYESRERKGKVIWCRGAEDRKGTRTNAAQWWKVWYQEFGDWECQKQSRECEKLKGHREKTEDVINLWKNNLLIIFVSEFASWMFGSHQSTAVHIRMSLGQRNHLLIFISLFFQGFANEKVLTGKNIHLSRCSYFNEENTLLLNC